MKYYLETIDAVFSEVKSSEAGLTSAEAARRLEQNGKNAQLVVKNSTLPMEAGSADRLFERFTREDTSRSSETGGFGLGLSIAKAVTEANGGSIHAVSEDGRSLTVTAELPLA